MGVGGEGAGERGGLSAPVEKVWVERPGAASAGAREQTGAGTDACFSTISGAGSGAVSPGTGLVPVSALRAPRTLQSGGRASVLTVQHSECSDHMIAAERSW